MVSVPGIWEQMVKVAFMVQINPNDQGGQMFLTRMLYAIKDLVTMNKKVLVTLPERSFCWLQPFSQALSAQNIHVDMHVGQQHANILKNTWRHFITSIIMPFDEH